MTMLCTLATALHQFVADCLVKRHADYLGFQSDKQTFTLASLEYHLMTVWMLVLKQNIFTDDNLLTHSVLFRSIQPWTFPCFNKIKQEIYHYDWFDPKRESLYSKKESPNFPCFEQNLYDRMILRHTVFTKLAWLFHVIVNISFSYDVLLITTALI